ncbi:hypothetical protein JCM15519_06690 [Fundidesulfovibrio butyratiphilus]
MGAGQGQGGRGMGVGQGQGGRGMGRNAAAFEDNSATSLPAGSEFAGQGANGYGNGQGQGGMRRRRRDGSCLREQGR